LAEKVSVREGEKVWLISRMEAIVRSLSLKALKGDQRATATVFAFALQDGQLEEKPEERIFTVEFVSPDGSRSRTPPSADGQTETTQMPVTSAPKK
jgi:hypothetical protein